jgi:hypothetical protein
VPVVATVESRSEFSWWCDIRIAVQAVTDFVRIFFVDACEGEVGKPLSRSNVKSGGHSNRLSIYEVRGQKKKRSAK